ARVLRIEAPVDAELDPGKQAPGAKRRGDAEDGRRGIRDAVVELRWHQQTPELRLVEHVAGRRIDEDVVGRGAGRHGDPRLHDEVHVGELPPGREHAAELDITERGGLGEVADVEHRSLQVTTEPGGPLDIEQVTLEPEDLVGGGGDRGGQDIEAGV